MTTDEVRSSACPDDGRLIPTHSAAFGTPPLSQFAIFEHKDSPLRSSTMNDSHDREMTVPTIVVRIGAAGAFAAAVLIGGQGSALATQGCTGVTASTVSRAVVPFGTRIVAPTIRSVDNFGQDVIVPEATRSHAAC